MKWIEPLNDINVIVSFSVVKTRKRTMQYKYAKVNDFTEKNTNFVVKFIAGYTSNINKEKHEVYKKKMDSLAGKGYNRA